MKTVKELMSLTDRTALITGGGGHIGFAIAEALAEAGAKIALVDRNKDQLEANAKSLRDWFSIDVDLQVVELADEKSVRELPQWVEHRFGSLDILFNCAAFVGTSALDGWAVPFEQQETKAWRAAFEVNVTAVFELVQAALPLLRRSGKGAVVNISSLYGVAGPDWGLYEGTKMGNPAAYGASKGALNQLTVWLATTLAPDVRVNCISPGGVWRNQPPEFIARYEERVPMKRMAIEEDFKGAALFLSSDLSAYVTGQNILVDGGWCAW